MTRAGRGAAPAAGREGPQEAVDTHFHLWDLEANYYPWLTDKVEPRLIGEYAPIRKDYLVSDFLGDIRATGVTKAVHVQADHDPGDPVRETRWLQGVADDPASLGFPQAIVAYADLGAGNAEEVLAGHCAYRNMRGIRQSLIRRKAAPGTSHVLDSPHWPRGLELLRKYGLSFDLQLVHPGMVSAAAMAGEHPDVQFILTHTGWPMRSDPDYLAAWRVGMQNLAERPNIAVKLSGFGFLDRAWTVDSIRPLILTSIDLFGVERCMFASNFPVDGMSRGYDAYWQAFERIVEPFTAGERRQMLSGNAERIYRI